jgi:hypothetical protein
MNVGQMNVGQMIVGQMNCRSNELSVKWMLVKWLSVKWPRPEYYIIFSLEIKPFCWYILVFDIYFYKFFLNVFILQHLRISTLYRTYHFQRITVNIRLFHILYLQLFNNCKVLKSPKFEAIETNTKRYSIIATSIIAGIP